MQREHRYHRVEPPRTAPPALQEALEFIPCDRIRLARTYSHRHRPQTQTIDTERAEQTHKHELLVLRFNKEQASDTQEAANEAEVLVQRQMKPPQQQPAASS